MERFLSYEDKMQTTCNEPTSHVPCTKLLSCGHPCQKNWNEVCTEECLELVNHTKPTFCGHKFKIECHLDTEQLPDYSITLLQFCKNPCTAVLACSHKCSGTCGECFQGRIHISCREKCGAILICGHQCKIPCREMCQPCQLECGMKCSHNECTKGCGEECTKCQETCTRRCKHIKCTSKCGDICNVPPCQEPCKKKLPCSHSCVGFCGDPCPPLCRICDATELGEVFLGYEDEEDARFVLLDECKHVIESQGMDSFCKRDGTKWIDYLRCPKCKTILTSTQRYSNYIKRSIKDVAAIRAESVGSFYAIHAKRTELQRQLVNIKQFRHGRVFSKSQGFDKFVNECDSLLQTGNENGPQDFNLIIGKTLQAKLAIVQNICSILQSQKLNVFKSIHFDLTPIKDKIFLEATAYVEYLLTRLTTQMDRITKQEIQDFEREQDRLQRIAQFINIAESSRSNEHREIRELIYRPILYNKNYDTTVKGQLEHFLKKNCVVGGLTEQERLEIVHSAGDKKGHWCKCPNGHIYSIGGCGFPMELGNCYECQVQIGGLYDALISSNSRTNEMDVDQDQNPTA